MDTFSGCIPNAYPCHLSLFQCSRGFRLVHSTNSSEGVGVSVVVLILNLKIPSVFPARIGELIAVVARGLYIADSVFLHQSHFVLTDRMTLKTVAGHGVRPRTGEKCKDFVDIEDYRVETLCPWPRHAE